jgi:DNA-binding transcriptional ArsR family regulator
MSAQTVEVDDIFTADLIDIRDTKLLGLKKAHEVWKLSALADRKERLRLAHELHRHEMFSLNQIAKIARLTVPTVSRHMKKNAEGGKFEPEVLSSLVYLRKLVIVNTHIPRSLVQTAAETGTSISTVARLTGASQTSLYLKAANN